MNPPKQHRAAKHSYSLKKLPEHDKSAVNNWIIRKFADTKFVNALIKKLEDYGPMEI